MANREFYSVLITGASSGIGAALALAYSAPGQHLFLIGRDRDRLDEVARLCRDKGAIAKDQVIDIRDTAAMANFFTEADQIAPLDLVIANAAIAGGGGEASGFEDQSREIFEVNVNGLLNTVFPAIEAMVPRGSGQIAIVASLLSFNGFQSAPAYSASKSVARTLGEGLRARFYKQGIGVSVVCPGYVHSRMSHGNPYPMPFIMTADKAAQIFVRGIARNKARIAFPWPLAFAVRLLSMMPAGVFHWITRDLPRKE